MGYINLLHMHSFIVPVCVSSGDISAKSSTAISTLDNVSGDQVVVTHIEPAASAELLSKDIATSFPGGDALSEGGFWAAAELL